MSKKRQQRVDGDHESVQYLNEWLLSITTGTGTTTERIGRSDVFFTITRHWERLIAEGYREINPWIGPPGSVGRFANAAGERVEMTLSMVPVTP